MPMVIEVNDLLVHAYHGVLKQEREVGNEFSVTVHLRYPAEDAADNDRLESTLNYADVCDLIRAEMRRPSSLLEHAAGRIRSALILRFPLICGGMVRVAKLAPPIRGAQVGSVAVKIEW